MKHTFILCFVCFFYNLGLAHKTNEAFFKFTQKKNMIEIEAEFPWTMRNALLKFNPSLKNSRNKKDFENTFIEYIKANLILKDKKGNVIKCKEFRVLENNGHSHQNNYLLIYDGTDLFEITNTIMFNLYDNQVNYNTLTVNSNTKTFETIKALNYFNLSQNNPSKSWYLIILILLLFYMVYRFYKKTTVNN